MPQVVRSGFQQLRHRVLRAGWLPRGSWRWRAAEELDDQVPVAETEGEFAVESARDEHVSPRGRGSASGSCCGGISHRRQEGDPPQSAPRIQTAALMVWATGRADRSGNVFRFSSPMAFPHGIAG